MDPRILNPGATVAQIDRELAAINEWLDADAPQYAEAMRDPSAHRDGVRLAIADCLCFRSSPDKLLARLWAWYALSSGD